MACSTSGVQLNVTAGATYYFMLGSFSPRPSFTFSVQTVVPPANDEITNAIPVGPLPFSATQDNQFASQNPSDPTPSCGAPNSNSVWYSYTPSAAGAIQVTTSSGGGFPAVPTIYTGPPDANATSPLTEVDCSTFTPLQLSVSAGVTYYIMLGGGDGSVPFTLNVQDIVPASNDEITNATPVGPLPFSATQDSLNATRNPSDPTPSCSTSINNYTVWYSYTPSADGLIQVTTSGGDFFPPTPTAYSGPANATPNSPLTEVGCSTFLPLQVNATAGTTYYFMVGSNSPRPSFTLDVTTAVPFAAPVITAPPVSVGTDPGQCGAAVAYTGLSITGNPTPSVFVSPSSGTFFGVGTGTVSVSAFNAIGFASTTFPVTVNDTETPQITAPASVTVDATGPGGAPVNYPPFTATDNCPGVSSHRPPHRQAAPSPSVTPS